MDEEVVSRQATYDLVRYSNLTNNRYTISNKVPYSTLKGLLFCLAQPRSVLWGSLSNVAWFCGQALMF